MDGGILFPLFEETEVWMDAWNRFFKTTAENLLIEFSGDLITDIPQDVYNKLVYMTILLSHCQPKNKAPDMTNAWDNGFEFLEKRKCNIFKYAAKYYVTSIVNMGYTCLKLSKREAWKNLRHNTGITNNHGVFIALNFSSNSFSPLAGSPGFYPPKVPMAIYGAPQDQYLAQMDLLFSIPLPENPSALQYLTATEGNLIALLRGRGIKTFKNGVRLVRFGNNADQLI